MKIFIGADHRGYQLKKKIVKHLTRQGYTVVDVGSHREGVMCDYPGISRDVASRVAACRGARGILLCMTGIGHSIAANKVRGAYAALCYTRRAAEYARKHNDSNILVLGARLMAAGDVFPVIRIWLKTAFEGGRHARRVRQIKNIEKASMKKRSS